VSRTPAAEGARLKVTYPLWVIERAGNGWRGRRLGYSFSTGAPTTGVLEVMIGSFEMALATGRSKIPANGARATGARVP
jgi:hypothetical protein